MPRQGRINVAGGIYHVIQRGIERIDIFRDDADREEFVRRLAEGLKETGHKCYGWALLPNHFHLLIRTGEKPLSDLMRKVLTGYAVYFNKKYKRVGYLYQNRYKSILCQEDRYLLELIRYIHLNPLRAKVVESIDGLSKYKWSGHSALVGGNKAGWLAVDEVLERFGRNRTEARRKYLEFVNDAKDVGRREELTGGGLKRNAGGWTGVMNLKRLKDRWQGDERILGDGDFVNEVLKESEHGLSERERLKREGWDKEKLIKIVCSRFSIDEECLRIKGRANKISNAKMMLAYIGNKKLGISCGELAKLLNCNRSGVGYLVRKGKETFRDNIVI